MVKSFRPGPAGHAPDDGAAQQFYVMSAAKPEHAGVAGGFVLDAAGPPGLVLPVQSFSLTGKAEPEQAGVVGGFVLDGPDLASPAPPAAGVIFPADDPPTVGDTQILIALKGGSLFLFEAALLSGDPLELRDALSDVGIAFDNSDRDSDVLEEYGLTRLLGGWLSDLHALTSSGGADLGGHNGIF